MNFLIALLPEYLLVQMNRITFSKKGEKKITDCVFLVNFMNPFKCIKTINELFFSALKENFYIENNQKKLMNSNIITGLIQLRREKKISMGKNNLLFICIRV